MVRIQILRPVDKGFPKYLSLEFDQTFLVVSIPLDVNAREMVFHSDPIWPPGRRKSWYMSGNCSDSQTCRQSFPKYLSLEFDQTFHIVSIPWGVNDCEMVFNLNPIWPPGMRKS